MTPEQHRRLGEIFDLIHELPSGRREPAIEQLCAGDPELRDAAQALFDADSRASRKAFLEHPAMEDAAQLLQSAIGPEILDTPAPGAVIGAYRLIRRIGAGGMGVVYEAEDLKLNRRVAIKLLPRVTGGSPERVQRFEREARAAGRLNHPGIASIYDAGLDQGFSYYAMELVAGVTLREMIRREPGRTEEKTVLEILSQIASALAAAHAGGIVHRDIKPENVIVRPDGLVKVLDFGLARMRERSSDRHDLRSRPGQIAGTVQYLSPEQVMGKPATPQSDVFSLGVVAYELACGTRPFEGQTDGAIFRAIVDASPAPPSTHRRGLSPGIDRLIEQAIEKDPDLRFHTADEFGRAVKRLLRGALPSPPVRPRRTIRTGHLALAAACGAILAGIAIYPVMKRTGAGSNGARPMHFEQLTNGTGQESFPSVSADGTQFVFASATGGRTDIYLQRVGGSKAIDLTADFNESNTQPSLSPTGTTIAFRSEQSGGGIFLMGSTGENPRRITSRGYLPAWSPDGARIAFCTHTFTVPSQVQPPPSELFMLDLATGAETKIATGDAMQPNWSPHGIRIAYWGVSEGGRRDIFTVDAAGKTAPVAVTVDAALDWNPVWSRSGKFLWFLSDRSGTKNVWRVPIDEESGRTLGPPEPMTVPAASVEAEALAGDGETLVFSSVSERSSLMRIPFDPAKHVIAGNAQAIGDARYVSEFTFSPDGSEIAYDTLGDTSEDLWIVKAGGSGLRRLTFDAFRNRAPQWSPRGDRIVFYSDRSGSYELWSIRPDGSGLQQVTAHDNPQMQEGVWSPDGSRFLAGRFGVGLMIDMAGPLPAVSPPEAPGMHQRPGIVCADWKRAQSQDLATCTRFLGPGNPELVIYSPATGQLDFTGVADTRAVWAPPSNAADLFRAVLFHRSSDLLLWDRVDRRESRLFSVAPNRVSFAAVAPDGRTVYFSQRIRHSDLWVGRAE